MTAPFAQGPGRPEDWMRNQPRPHQPILPSNDLLLPQEMLGSGLTVLPEKDSPEFFHPIERVVLMVTCILASTASVFFIYGMIRVLMFFSALSEKMDSWNNLLN